MKRLLTILIIFVAISFWYIEHRNIYHVGKKDITIWKMIGNTCYILPYKYFGIFAPNSDYIKIQNTNMDVVVAWDKSDLNTILVYSYDKRISVNSQNVKFSLLSREGLEKKIYEQKGIRLKNELKNSIELIGIHAFEAWATDKNGIVL